MTFPSQIPTFANISATLAATTPVLAFVAGLAVVTLVAPDGDAPEATTDAGADHPRRGARTVQMSGHSAAQDLTLDTTGEDRRGARRTVTFAAASNGPAIATGTDRARVIHQR